MAHVAGKHRAVLFLGVVRRLVSGSPPRQAVDEGEPRAVGQEARDRQRIREAAQPARAIRLQIAERWCVVVALGF